MKNNNMWGYYSRTNPAKYNLAVYWHTTICFQLGEVYSHAPVNDLIFFTLALSDCASYLIACRKYSTACSYSLKNVFSDHVHCSWWSWSTSRPLHNSCSCPPPLPWWPGLWPSEVCCQTWQTLSLPNCQLSEKLFKTTKLSRGRPETEHHWPCHHKRRW